MVKKEEAETSSKYFEVVEEVREKIDYVIDETRTAAGCLYALTSVSLLGMTLSFGPLDLGRTLYNQLIGDMPVLKKKLVDFARRDVYRVNPDISPENVESILAKELRSFTGKAEINPNEIPISDLWDLQENRSRTFKDQWVWANLE